MIPDKGFSGFKCVVEDIINHIELEQGMNLLFHDLWFRRRPGPELKVFD